MIYSLRKNYVRDEFVTKKQLWLEVNLIPNRSVSLVCFR